VLLGLEGKAVHVDTNRGDVGVVLVGLDQVEVATLTLVEAIVAVELDLGRNDRIVTGHALDTRNGVPRLEDGAVPPVGVVEGLLTLEGLDDGIIAADEGITLNNPDKLLARVVEVELDLVGGRGDGLRTRELELLDEVLVGDRGKAATLIRVEVDVVDVERGADEARGGDTVADLVRGGRGAIGIVEAEVVEGLELEVDLDLVVLEGNQGERKTRVAAEPELERDVQRLHRRARTGDARVRQLRRRARRIQRDTVGRLEENQVGGVAEHVLEGLLRARGLRELRPDLHPVAVLAVNARAAHLNLNLLDEAVADVVEPAEAVRGARVQHNLRESNLDVRAVH